MTTISSPASPGAPPPIVIRAIRPEDKQALSDGVDRLSDRSRYRRFLSPHGALTPAELTYFTEVDHHDHEALVAIDPATGHGIGVARYIRSRDHPDSAELAVAVADDWQHHGVGTRLTEALADRAREEGITRFTALLLADNTPMLRLIQSLGVVHGMSVEQGIVELIVELPADSVGKISELLRATAVGELQSAGHPAAPGHSVGASRHGAPPPATATHGDDVTPPDAAALPDITCACLVVMDGWGIAPAGPGNAIALASTPVFDQLQIRYPNAALSASGRDVGLPDGQMGNSEVGHLTLGAGAAVPQTLTMINDAVAGGGLEGNQVVRAALTASERVHLVGMVSEGGVHSAFGHLEALIALAAELGTSDLVVHCFTDGRDTSPTAAAAYLQTLQDCLTEAGVGRVASVIGRFYAMDRDRRWERTQAAYDLIVHGRGAHHAPDAPSAARDAYQRSETDEFITATTVGAPGAIRAGDSVLCFNFRPDRMREIVRALAEPGFGDGDELLPGWRGRDGAGPVRALATMTEYQHGWPYPVAFSAAHPATTLAAVLARAGAEQLHVAETEKYAHVTYFFNGGVEAPFPRERRELVASQRDVPTYDLKPQMSAREITTAFTEAFTEDRPRFSVINFANADMVGHTGVIPATIIAVETVDECLGHVIETVHAAGGVCVITADHGNAEQMLEPDGATSTAHSVNPVPLIVTARGVGLQATGTLADVAPTVLALLGLAAPEAMTGHPLLTTP